MDSEIYGFASTVLTVLAGGGIGWMLRSGRRKSAAEADKEEISALHMSLEQIKDLQREMGDKTEKIRSLTSEVIAKMTRIHELEKQLLSSRCDLVGCLRRRPPLPWMSGAGERENDESDNNKEEGR